MRNVIEQEEQEQSINNSIEMKRIEEQKETKKVKQLVENGDLDVGVKYLKQHLELVNIIPQVLAVGSIDAMLVYLYTFYSLEHYNS